MKNLMDDVLERFKTEALIMRDKSNVYVIDVVPKNTELLDFDALEDAIFVKGNHVFGFTKSLEIVQKTSPELLKGDILDADAIRKAIIEDLSTNQTLENLLESIKKPVRKVTTAIAYELLTNEKLNLSGSFKVYTLPSQLPYVPVLDDLPQGISTRKKELTYQKIKEKILNFIGNNRSFAFLKLFVEYLDYLIKRKHLKAPSDPASATIYSLSKLNRRILKRRNSGSRFRTTPDIPRNSSTKQDIKDPGEIEVYIDTKKIKLHQIPNFLSKMSKRLGDVYLVLFDKALKNGFTEGEKRYVHITAREIATELSKSQKPSKDLIREVAEALVELRSLSIKLPASLFPKELRKKGDQYYLINPFIFLDAASEDEFDNDVLRIHRAIVVIHPRLWYLFYNMRHAIDLPREVLKLSEQSTPERWAKSITYFLYHYAHKNRKKGDVHKIGLKTVLDSTFITDELKEMFKTKNHKRALKYLHQALRIAEIYFEKFELSQENFSSQKELFSITITFSVLKPLDR